MRHKILFLSQSLPYPPHSGVTNRTFHILSELEKEFDITLIAFSRRNHQPDEESRVRARRALSNTACEVREPSPIASEWSRLNRLWNHARSFVLRRPYVYYDYASQSFADELRDTLHGTDPALIHLDSLDLYRWHQPTLGVPVACTHHSIESDLLRLRAAQVGSFPLRWYLRHQADLLTKVEIALCGAIDLNVMMSDLDAARLRALVPGAKTAVVPNGVDTDYFRSSSPGEAIAGRIAFLGPTYMLPNRDGIDFFLQQIWPIVRQRAPASSLHLIGRNSSADRDRLSIHPGVTCQGHVPDIRPHMQSAQCSIVPLRIGGGTRLKILDAWAMGKAVVSTAIGCEGLATKNGDNILIRDNPVDFADAVLDVLSDDRLRARLERNGRTTAEEVYSWPIIGDQLRATYASLIRAGATYPTHRAS